MKYSDMIVYGVEISQDVQKSAVEAFLTEIENEGAQSFEFMRLLLQNRGIDKTASYRGADRLLQKMRKSKLIGYSPLKGGWFKC